MDTNKDGETVVYVFYWHIENFRCYWKENIDVLSSPSFCTAMLQNTKWKLRIRRLVKPDEINLLLSLQREEDNGPREVVVNLELGFVREDYSVIKKWSEKNFTFSKDMRFTAGDFVLKEEQFTSNYSLMTHCRLRQRDAVVTEIRKQFVKTIVNIHQRTFVWNVENFSLIHLDLSNTICVKEDFGTAFVNLKLFLKEKDSREEVNLCVSLMSSEIPPLVTFRWYLMDTGGNKSQGGLSLSILTNYNIFDLFPKDEILQNKDLYLKNDTLSLYCEFNFSSGIPRHNTVKTTGDFLYPTTNNVYVEALSEIHSE